MKPWWLMMLFCPAVLAGSNPLGKLPLNKVLKDLLPQTQNLDDCGLHPKARELAQLILNDKEQQRPRLVCNPILSKVAAEKAKEMADKGIVSHYASNRGANVRLRLAGYELPPHYPSFHNNQVEAVAGGYQTAEEVWEGFKYSDVHRLHVLGEIPFFREQDEIGVGFYRKWESPHVEYWAVYIARKAEDADPHVICLSADICVN